MLRTWNLNLVNVTLGPLSIKDGTEDEFVTIARANTAEFTVDVGTHGEVTRSRSTNKSAIISLTFSRASQNNTILDNLMKQDLAASDSGDGAAIFPVDIKHKAGPHFIGEDCFILEAPDMAFNRAAGNVTWKIFVSKCDESSYRGVGETTLAIPSLEVIARSVAESLF